MNATKSIAYECAEIFIDNYSHLYPETVKTKGQVAALVYTACKKFDLNYDERNDLHNQYTGHFA